MLLVFQAAALGADDAALKKRLKEVRTLAPVEFTVLTESPFIVAGDESPAKVRERAEKTVRWTVERLKRDFFAKDPDEVIAIWLFRDKASYEGNIQRLFHQTAFSPFGYYSVRDQTLFMNIGTGEGTLVHEIVHPYVRANFPACPAWFNEGLGSLFEQSAERDGDIRGLPNWRLPGLQEAIRAKTTLPFEQFTAMSTEQFYGDSAGYNRHYGQARYLCYYLQEQGLLVKFYREFSEHAAEDPTGFKSLKRVLGAEDIPAFQRQWENFVLGLRYP